MSDPTEEKRRVLQALVNEGAIEPDGEAWTTDELTKEFDVMGFAAPFVVVRRKSDGKQGSLVFRHSPRIYWGFTEAL